MNLQASRAFIDDLDRELFLDWILSDRAWRAASGKNPDAPMLGIWITRTFPASKGRGKAGVRRGKTYLRGSDESERRYVAILVLKEKCGSVKAACADLAVRLGERTEKQVARSRSAFYKFHHPAKAALLDMWLGYFKGWRRWLAHADIQFHTEQIREEFGQGDAQAFGRLARRIRPTSP